MDGVAVPAEDENETAIFSCLAITAEKRPQGQGQRRPSGCTGIFYQLFDWNRRLAKNSHKNKLHLISSGTPKNSTSKRFGAHDELLLPPTASKFHLIAEENGRGFPNAKKHRMDLDIVQHKPEMRPPSLVAKLMGLDAIPTPKKLKQTRSSPHKMDEKRLDACNNHQDSVVEELGKLDNNEPWPQKQRRTGQLDMHAVGRFGQDALQLKTVLSRSRKHLLSHKGSHHPKLPSPVKSPRVRSGKNAARLIDAATKILEPRLRVSNSRANAITYPHYLRHEMREQSVVEGSIVKPSDPSTRSVYDSGMQSPCKNCGLPNGDTGVQQVAWEQQSKSSFQYNVSGYDSLSPQKWHCRSLTEEDIDKPPEFGRIAGQDCNLTHRELVQEKRSVNGQGQNGRHFSTTQHDTEVKLPTHSSDAFSPQHQKTNKTPFYRENIPSRPTLSRLQSGRVTSAKIGITKNQEMSTQTQRVSGRSQYKLPRKVDNERFPHEMEQSTSKSQLKTPERKRRITNATGQVEYSPYSLGKPGITEYYRNPSSSPSNQSRSSSNSKFGSPRTRKTSSEPSSFTFQSPAKYKSEIPMSNEKIGSITDRLSMSKEKTAHSVTIQPKPVSSDVLDTLLKQKLKELASQEQRDQGIHGAQSKTSKILQELISALATEHHASTDLNHTEFTEKRKTQSCNVASSTEDILHHHDHSRDIITAQKGNKMTEDPSISCFCDSDHLSPGSVLGASFSNRSCISSSLDYSSEFMSQHRLMDYAHCISPPSEPAIQLKQVKSTHKRTTLDLFINRISVMVEELMQCGATFSSSKVSHMKEVVLHAGLVLENEALTKGGKQELFICHFFDQLETFANTMCLNSKDPSAYKEGKVKTQLRGILLDLAVEYLDSRFGNNSIPIFNLLWRLPLKLTAHQLILGVNSKITQWASLAGKRPDELIEWDVSHNSGYWDGYETEASCVCCELAGEVLKTLVDEIVMDFYQITC